MPDDATTGATPLVKRRHWVFDMDGTLTVAAHDFAAIRRALDIPFDQPILETIARLPPDEAARKTELLDELEHEAAERSRPMPGAADLLKSLHDNGVQLGILTRNNLPCAHITLAACGFDHYFGEPTLLHRDSCAPKPEPDGVIKLLKHWQASADDAVMVGDYLYDLQAGRRAGTGTIYLDTSGQFTFRDHADFCVASLSDIAL
ncbi:MAG: HAD family hydrolase [Pseudomonadota bacterium]